MYQKEAKILLIITYILLCRSIYYILIDKILHSMYTIYSHLPY